MTIFNSPYFYNLNVIRGAAKVVMTKFTIFEIVYIYNLCKYVTIIMPLKCNYIVNL
jgi:hypothetical protein